MSLSSSSLTDETECVETTGHGVTGITDLQIHTHLLSFDIYCDSGWRTTLNKRNNIDQRGKATWWLVQTCDGSVVVKELQQRVNQCDVNRTQVSLQGVLKLSRSRELDIKAMFSFCSLWSLCRELLNVLTSNPKFAGSSKQQTSQTSSYSHISKSLTWVNGLSQRWYLYLRHMVSKSAQEKLRMRTSGRGVGASYLTTLPEISARLSLLDSSFRYLLPGSEGEKGLPLDYIYLVNSQLRLLHV